jgi:hypothetical protein
MGREIETQKGVKIFSEGTRTDDRRGSGRARALPVAGRALPVAGRPLPVAGRPLPVAGRAHPVAGRRPQVSN